MRNLLNNIGELIIDRNRFGKNLSSMNALRSELKQNRARLSDAIAQFRREFEYTNVSKKAAAEASGETRSAGPEAGTERPDGTGNGNGNGKKAELGFEEAFGDFSDIEFDRYDEFNVLARVLEEIVDDIDEIGRSIENTTQRLTDNNAEFSKTSRQLQHELSSLNMMPAHSLFRRLERVFRSALEDSGKTASIHFEGEETMIDRAMLEQLYAPLMHLVRNCVAHGIEPREERLQQDKPPSGQVEVKAFNLSNQVVIEVSDDGAGIREEAVRERGIRDGKLPEDSGELPREKILELLFSSGFSTQRDVTNLAGRGVGLEVVKREVEDLNGALRLAYEPGQYCRWTIQLPLTVSATEAALVEAGGARFAIPLSFVEGGLLLDDEHLRDEGDGQEFYLLDDGQEVPLRNLATLLDLDRHDPAGTQALMLNTGGFRVALRIDRLAGREEIVVKSLGGILGEHPFYSGATLDEEGRPMLILNAPNLAALIRSGETRAAFAGLMRRRTPEARQPAAADPAGTGAETHVLVVDDSLSVRKSLERGLRQIGCEVSLAADGADALDQMRTRLFDLILTDLEMPRMDGFQLITETRDLDMWSGVPIYVVTSRVTEKYRRRAEQLGANGFLSKPVRVEDLERILAKISSR
jgi:chemosensory pili system protein ChpA (sensor histidine kinase/response regulator)